MRVAAFSTFTGASAVRKATGVEPITFPPKTAQTLNPSELSGFDVLYFHLHGLPDQPFWYGDGWSTAITIEHILNADVSGAIVFVANCFGSDSKLLAAFKLRGSGAIVAGSGENQSAMNEYGMVFGADRLGKEFLKALYRGMYPAEALEAAKRRIRLWAFVSKPDRDALEFHLV